MAVRAPTVEERPEFTEQCLALRVKYPELDIVLAEFRALLILDYALPHVPVDVQEHPGVYAVKLDYPPHGSNGLGVLLVTYHVTDRSLSMTEPLCVYTFLTIDDLG